MFNPRAPDSTTETPHLLGVTTVVLLAGGDGLLLLNDRQPARASGSNTAINPKRMKHSLQYTRRHISPYQHRRCSIILA
jgi:hypothetical protein